MAGTGIRVELNQAQVEHVNKILYTTPDKARTVFRNSFNRGLVAARTQAAKEIKERYDITTANLRTYENIKLMPASQTGSEVVGQIVFAGSKIPLYRFHPSPKERKYTKKFVNGRSGWRITSPVKAADVRASGMIVRKPAFIATFHSGHTGIFRRDGDKKTSKGKTKLKEYFGLSVADMLDYEEARDAVQERAAEIVSKRLDQELYRMLNGF